MFKILIFILITLLSSNSSPGNSPDLKEDKSHKVNEAINTYSQVSYSPDKTNLLNKSLQIVGQLNSDANGEREEKPISEYNSSDAPYGTHIISSATADEKKIPLPTPTLLPPTATTVQISPVEKPIPSLYPVSPTITPIPIEPVCSPKINCLHVMCPDSNTFASEFNCCCPSITI